MKITLGSKTLLEKLQFVGGIIPSSSPLPILQNFLFDFDQGVLKMTASDTETTISTTMEVDNNDKVNVAIPAKMLLEILKAFPDQPLTFEINPESSTIKISSSLGQYEIAFEDGAHYPKALVLDKPATISIPAKVLAAAIGKTLFSTGNDDLRPVMSGVFFEFSTDQLNFVATDANKLVQYCRNDIKAEESAEFVVPKKPLSVLKSILASTEADVVISYNIQNAVFQLDNYLVTCRLVDGKFPNYRAVLPTDNPNVMIIDRTQLLNSMKCVSIFANKMTHQVKLDIKGSELQISAEDIDFSNKADERLTCNYEGNDMAIGFNSRFLLEMLSNLTCNTIKISMSEPNKASILTPADGSADGEKITMLLMPSLLSK